MATLSGAYCCDNSTLANFKAWAMAISAAFTSFGWTQSSDTGQVTWSSVSAVPSSTYVYEIWEMADTLQSTMPVFVKIQYGYSSTAPRIGITVGTGSNGTGTITGVVCSSVPWLSNYDTNYSASVPLMCYFSGSTNRISFYMWSHPTTATMVVFSVERAHDSSGADLSTYVTAAFGAADNISTNNAKQQTFTSTVLGNLELSFINVPLSSGSNTGYANGTVACMPIFPVLGKVLNPLLGLASCASNDASNGSIITLSSFYGSTHTYVCCYCSGGYYGYMGLSKANAGTNMALLVRYE